MVMLSSAVANSVTMFTILRVPALRRNLDNILILNLRVMDLVTTLASMPFSLMDVFFEGYLLCLDILCRVSLRV